MNGKITIGQFYPADSYIHHLDPRTKIICTFVYLISLFLFNSIWTFAVATVFLALVITECKVPLGFILKGLKAVFILLIITALFNLFLTQGTVLVKFWIFKITEEGIRNAVLMAVRLVYLVVGASVMTLSTSPNALTDGTEKILRPLGKIKVPVHEIAMMMSIALRFIPILVEETDKIMKAQKARGADIDTGTIIQKAKAMVPILVPLFVSAFRRANDLAMAMEARCYHGGDNRTRMKVLKYSGSDITAYIVTALYLACIILVGIFVKIPLWVF